MLAGRAGPPPEGAGEGWGADLPKPPNENCCEAQPASCSAARITSVAPSDERRTDMDGLLDAQDAHSAHPHTLGMTAKLRAGPSMVPAARGNALFKLKHSR